MERKDLRRAGIVGAGVMGRGIAQWAAEAGCDVLLFDAQPGQASAALELVVQQLDRNLEKGRIDKGTRDAIAARLAVADDLQAFAGADLVIEAIVEDLGAKQRLFQELEAIVAPDAILTTNTSSLSVTACASACQRPERVAGLHFFNPVPLMKVVEVVGGVLTSEAVMQDLLRLVSRSSHRAIACADTPGFVVNHAGRGLVTEGLRIVQEGVAETTAVDEVMREAGGFPMGPFELLDLTGLDVSSRVLQEIYDQFLQDPRYRPTPMVRTRVAAGLFGRKVGRGFYLYDKGKKVPPPEQPTPVRLAGTIHIAIEDADVAARVRAILIEGGAELSPDLDSASAIVVAPLGDDATTTASTLGLDAQRVVAVDQFGEHALAPGGRATLMTTPATRTAARDAVHGALRRAGMRVTVIRDSPGFILQRTIATIVNIGCEIAQQRIASPADIDLGVKLGLGYPAGPLSLGDRYGPANIHKVLAQIHAATGDPRYRTSLWLSRRAMLGMSLLAADE